MMMTTQKVLVIFAISFCYVLLTTEAGYSLRKPKSNHKNFTASTPVSQKNSFNIHNLEDTLESIHGVKPKFIYFPTGGGSTGSSSGSGNHKNADSLTSSNSNPTGSSSSAAAAGKDSISRIGSKYSSIKQEAGNNGGPPQKPDFLSSIGSVLGIAGLGILFIAEVSSSFAAPFLIPVMLVPLGIIILLRLAYDELNMGQVDLDMYM